MSDAIKVIGLLRSFLSGPFAWRWRRPVWSVSSPATPWLGWYAVAAYCGAGRFFLKGIPLVMSWLCLRDIPRGCHEGGTLSDGIHLWRPPPQASKGTSHRHSVIIWSKLHPFLIEPMRPTFQLFCIVLNILFKILKNYKHLPNNKNWGGIFPAWSII